MPTRTCTELAVLDNVTFGRSEKNTHFFALRLERPEWADWKPGQFLMLRPLGKGEDILTARPFSICRISSHDMVIFFQVLGRATERMASLRQGDRVLVWGPLGNGFLMEQESPTLIVAGGIGIAPFIGYVHSHPEPWNVSMLFGHSAPAACYPVDSINERIMVEPYHDIGMESRAAFQAAIRENMKEHAEKNGLVLCCGPTPFLRLIQEYAAEFSVRTQISLETRMACGVGACLGCVTTTSGHWPDESKVGRPVATCSHGPVFWSDQILLKDALL